MHDAAAPTPRRLALLLEACVLFVLVPVVLVVIRREFSRWMMPVLVAVAVFCLVVLLRDPAFDRSRLGYGRDFRRGLRWSLLLLLLGAALLLGLTRLLRPDLLFALPQRDPGLWLLILVLYPLFSVYPQELIFRTFLFHRYRGWLRGEHQRVVASGVAFSLAHLFFGNWIAPLLTLAGGLVLARGYAHSGSTLRACLEHALWGNWLFTVGLGWYFWGGSIRG